MFWRMVAISFIFVCTSVAWMTLGGSITYRTDSSDRQIREEVMSLWGTEQRQAAPSVSCEWATKTVTAPASATGAAVMATEEVELSASRVRADINMDYRRRGLLWYSAYKVGFDSKYKWKNDKAWPVTCVVNYAFPAKNAIYDNFVFSINGKKIDDFNSRNDMISQEVKMGAGETGEMAVSYTTRGLDEWTYELAGAQPGSGDDGGEYGRGGGGGSGAINRVRNLDMEVRTHFDRFDLPLNTSSPGRKVRTKDGWLLEWKYSSLISGFRLGVKMPAKLNPGPLAAQISYFAPVSLFFFFLVIFVTCMMRDIDLHPMNYVFLAAAFFSFHLLLAYLADQIDIMPSFIIAAVVSVILVVSYLRLVAGMKFAVAVAGGAQLIYLVLFSYAHFLKGITGLAITLVSVATLFFLMQLTGRINWSEKFKKMTPPKLPRVREAAAAEAGES